jgi:DNA ligase-1
MLAQSAEAPEDVLDGGGESAFELKLDSARIQVHRDDDDVRVYTRALNEVTAAVPDIVDAVRAISARAFVLDGEAIALDPSGRPRPFQMTMKRFGRRLDVDRFRQELPLSACFFDCLHLEGNDLIDRTARERFDALSTMVPAPLIIRRLVTHEPMAARAFLSDALSAGHEGLVAKSLDARYEAGRRGAGWIKIKPVRTLDLVVLAIEWGSGRRRNWLSNIHLGARDPESGAFVMLGKTFKGMTDAMLAWQTEHFAALETYRERQVVHVRPETVVEIAFDGLQASSHYPGGVALRFARVRRYRPDKSPLEADTMTTVRAIFEGTDRS